MKPVALLILAAGLCACSGRPAGEASSDAGTPAPAASTADRAANGAAPTAPASPDATGTASPTTAPAAPTPNATAATPGPDDAAGSSPPSGARGIAVGEPNPATPLTPVGLARFDGYGDMKFGMDTAAARKAWAGDLKGTVRGRECGYLWPVSSKPASNFAFMFEGGKFVRYDVGNTREVAPGGGRVGMKREEIERLYVGRLQASKHHYVQGGEYLKVRGDGGAIVFETDARGVVTSWRAGIEPQVNYIEGCS